MLTTANITDRKIGKDGEDAKPEDLPVGDNQQLRWKYYEVAQSKD